MPQNRELVRGWTTASDLRAQLQKQWDRGELLGNLVANQSLFPKHFSLRVPTSADMLERFEEVRSWIQEVQAIPHCRVQLREVKHRILGTNLVPEAIWLDSIEDAFALLGKQREVSRFVALVELTRTRHPALLTWVSQNALTALEVSEHWNRLLDVVAWVQQHPRPGVYVRQADIPGIDTKFVEAQQPMLAELLNVVLPPEAINADVSGTTQFEERYGFLSKPNRIRFRILDRDRTVCESDFRSDITLDGGTFARLAPNVTRVFITENEINYLAFPEVAESLMIFGAGYGFRTLSNAKWLSQCQIYYWGDIDTHGFAILDQLRGEFGQVESFLMDRATLMAFPLHWGVEEKQTVRDLVHLNAQEQQLYDDLRDNRIRQNLRLEQERIGFQWVESRIKNLVSGARGGSPSG